MKMQNPGPDSRTAIPKTPGAMAKSLDFKKLHTALGDLWTQNRKGGVCANRLEHRDSGTD